MKRTVHVVFLFTLAIIGFCIEGCKKTDNTIDSIVNPTVTPPIPATITLPNTAFIESDYNASNFGAYWVQQFTITTNTSFVFRFANQYKAQAAIITPDQLINFQTNKAFTGYAIFDNQFGTKSIVLTAGTYYVAIRNTNNGANKWRVELDYAIALPASDKAVFYDTYFSAAKEFTKGSRLWQLFTVQSGFRYFLDGCNVGLDVYVIHEDQLSAFQGGGSFKYYSEYHTGSGADPGLSEVKLPPGNYYLVALSAGQGSITYTMERWRLN